MYLEKLSSKGRYAVVLGGTLYAAAPLASTAHAPSAVLGVPLTRMPPIRKFGRPSSSNTHAASRSGR